MDNEESKSTTSKRTTRSQTSRQSKGKGQVILDNIIDKIDNISKHSQAGSVSKFDIDMADTLCNSSVKPLNRSIAGDSVVSAATGRLSMLALSNAIKEEEEASNQELERVINSIEADALARKTEARREHGLKVMNRSNRNETLIQTLNQHLMKEQHSDKEELKVASKSTKSSIVEGNRGRNLMDSFLEDCYKSRQVEQVEGIRSSRVESGGYGRNESNGLRPSKAEYFEGSRQPRMDEFGHNREETRGLRPTKTEQLDGLRLPKTEWVGHDREEPCRMNLGKIDHLDRGNSRIDETKYKPREPKELNVCKAELPRIELPKFDGGSAAYWNFIRQFEIHVERRTEDEEQRMLFLLNHCTGRAKRAIAGCGNSLAAGGYREAKATLQRMYGKPHAISKDLIDRLLRLPNIRTYDEEAFEELVLCMTECYNTLREMNYMADLDSIVTLHKIVSKLPPEVVDRWIRRSDKIYATNREPNFVDLKEFVTKEASLSGNRFTDIRTAGLGTSRNNSNVNSPRLENRWRSAGNGREETWRNDRNKVINYINQPTPDRSTSQVCIICKESHSTAQCRKYIELPVSLRWEQVKNGGGCFSCLEVGHTVKACPNRKPCNISECQKRHHPSLHREMVVVRTPEKLTLNTIREADSYVSLGLLEVVVEGPKGYETICALLDTGSNTTLIREEITNRLGIKGTVTDLSINTIIGGSVTKAKRCGLTVRATDRSDSVGMTGVYAVRELPVRLFTRTMGKELERWPHLRGVPRNEKGGRSVDMIIGYDQPKAHWVDEYRRGSESQPCAMKTPLGWVILGPTQGEATRTVCCTNVQETERDNRLDEMIQQLYNQEFEDIGSNEKGMSIEEKEAVEILTSGTTREEGRYVVPLPWKVPSAELDNNRAYAEKRLLSLRRRFVINTNLIGRYDEIIRSHLSKGYISRVPSSLDDQPRAWYLPHHPVFNPHKPDKLRIVFDCAAKYRGKAINDCLHQGPDTIASLVGVLLRFRRWPVVIMGDIEEMFLQVRLKEEDRDWMRFLWWKEGRLGGEIETYRMMVHPFGARSSPFCANFAMKQAVIDNEIELSKTAMEVARSSIYVDDCIASVRSVEEAKRVIGELSAVMKLGGFKLRKWLSNKREVLANVPSEDLAKGVQLMVEKGLPSERTLGVEWNAEADELTFTFRDQDKPSTRRGLLSTIAAVFDPLGLISPVIMRAKMLLQSICKRKLGWDQALEYKDLQEWNEWKEQMKQLHTLSFPRCLRMNEAGPGGIQLHLFADASEVGYGAVAYVRTSTAQGFECTLLMAKARVAPLKIVTIPRLELNAAVLAIRMGNVIKREIGVAFEKTYYWVDSMIVLRYLQNTSSRFVTFVANRVQEILESSRTDQWKHVRTELNPADYTSRGLQIRDPKLKLWFKGPGYLSEAECLWPTEITDMNGGEELETRKVVLHLDKIEDGATDKLLNYYSEWTRLVRAVSWVTRFIRYLRVMKGKVESVNVGPLRLQELEGAEHRILMHIQRSAFATEYNMIVHNKQVEEGFNWGASRLKKLCPAVSNDLIVVGGRLQAATMTEEQKHPAILPKEHAVTKALIMHYHKLNGHAGVSQTLVAIREKYWVLHGGATVKAVLRRCLTCRRLNATSMKQQMATLPKARVQDGWYPFQIVGMDFFGPFQVIRGRLLEKRYGCLFTCLQCRAIHLELVQSLSTDSFILALMRFINRRGTPVEINSDNGGNFLGAKKELKEWLVGLDQQKITSKMIERKIEWKFNPPNASHRGGIWERMIRSVRKILNSVAGRQSMSEEVLWTYLTQAERVVNDRPLTAVREGMTEPTPIRASDLLQPKSGTFIAINLPLNQLVERRWRLVNNLTAEFWKKWKVEYLAALQERHKWLGKHKALKVGDIVITEVESTPRTYWPMGIIEEVIPDGDGLVRTVVVKTSKGLCRRDIRKVYLLEGLE